MIEKHKAEIASLLFSNEFPIRLNEQDIQVGHLINGKSAYVYEVTLLADHMKFAVKVFDGQWQKREIEVYRNHLGAKELLTPKFIYADQSERFLVLEWLTGYSSPKKHSQIQFDALADWLNVKYNYFKKINKGLSVNSTEKLPWLLDNPIAELKKASIQEFEADLKNLLQHAEQIREKLLRLDQRELPMIFDHNDLEIQNIMQNAQGDIRIIDWANLTKFYGFFDFAQFKKNLILADAEYKYADYQKRFTEVTQLSDFDQLVALFALIKEIQLLAYYMKDGSNQSNSLHIALSFTVIDRELPILF